MITIDRTRTLADERGVSLSFLCRKMGVAKAYFLDREKAGREISIDRLEMIAKCLYTTVEYLSGQTDKKEKPTTHEGSELMEDVVIYHRDGKTVIKKFSSEKLALVDKMLSAIEDDNDPRL